MEPFGILQVKVSVNFFMLLSSFDLNLLLLTASHHPTKGKISCQLHDYNMTHWCTSAKAPQMKHSSAAVNYRKSCTLNRIVVLGVKSLPVLPLWKKKSSQKSLVTQFSYKHMLENGRNIVFLVFMYKHQQVLYKVFKV